MTVQCANCGEELLGSVNRCWRCGQLLVAHAGPTDVPPVRRAPIAGSLQAPLDAVLIDGSTQIATAAPVPRKGSPFASVAPPGGPSTATSVVTSLRRKVPARPSLHVASQVAGAASILMALIALAISFAFPPGALAIALAGIGFGIWGLYSPKRLSGITGLVLCCIALALAAFLTTVELYTYVYGVSPFSSPMPAADPSLVQ